MVTFAVGMNRDRRPWSGIRNGGSKTSGFGDPIKADGPERYVAPFSHVVDLFKREGVKRGARFLHADFESVPEAHWNAIWKRYPGDDYADWVDVSVYKPEYNNEDWLSFDTITGPVCRTLTGFSRTNHLCFRVWENGRIRAIRQRGTGICRGQLVVSLYAFAPLTLPTGTLSDRVKL